MSNYNEEFEQIILQEKITQEMNLRETIAQAIEANILWRHHSKENCCRVCGLVKSAADIARNIPVRTDDFLWINAKKEKWNR